MSFSFFPFRYRFGLSLRKAIRRSLLLAAHCPRERVGYTHTTAERRLVAILFSGCRSLVFSFLGEGRIGIHMYAHVEDLYLQAKVSIRCRHGLALCAFGLE